MCEEGRTGLRGCLVGGTTPRLDLAFQLTFLLLFIICFKSCCPIVQLVSKGIQTVTPGPDMLFNCFAV